MTQPRSLIARAQVTGQGQFVDAVMTRDFARQLLDELRAAPRSPAIELLGRALREELLALKVMPKVDYQQITETKRSPFTADGPMTEF